MDLSILTMPYPSSLVRKKGATKLLQRRKDLNLCLWLFCLIILGVLKKETDLIKASVKN